MFFLLYLKLFFLIPIRRSLYLSSLTAFLLDSATKHSVNIFCLVSMGHVVKIARLADVDDGAIKVREQTVSFVVVHGRPAPIKSTAPPEFANTPAPLL